MKINLGWNDVRGILNEDVVLEGSEDFEVTGIASLGEAGPSDLSFISHPKYVGELEGSSAGVVLVPKSLDIKPAEGQRFIRVEDPSLALGEICAMIEQQQRPSRPGGMHSTSVVADDAIVASDAYIGPFCIVESGVKIDSGTVLAGHVFVGAEAAIGKDCRIESGVNIYSQCVVKSRCILHSGVVLGADGYGYHSGADGHRKLPQIGNVVIEDDVEIGANSTIDRARFASTRIGEGTKIDNLVQIGHNCVIGKHCIICANVGISGSVHCGDFVTMAGQVGVAGHLKIGSGAIVMGQAGITKDVPPKAVIAGTPARPHREQRRVEAITQRLPEMKQTLRELEEIVKKNAS